jgi:exonuclease VII small subunit
MHIDRIHDLDKKKFENDVMHKLQNIVQNLEPPKPEIPKTVLQTVNFEDAIKELLQLNQKIDK